MEGNQVGNRLVPGGSGNASSAFGMGINAGVDIGATFGNGNNRSAEAASGRLAAEKNRKAQIQQQQRLAARLKQRKNPSATAAALTWDTTPADATAENPNPIPDEGLVWPTHLIEEIARARKPKNVQLRLARALFFLGSLAALAAGPVQLALVAIFQDAEWVRTVYAPTSGKIALGFLILFNLLLIPQLFKTLQNLRETTNNPFTNVQPFSAKVRHRTLVYAFGLLLLSLIIWLGIMLELPAQVLTILVPLIVLLTPFFSLCVQKNVLPSRLGYMALQVFLVASMVLSGLETILSFFAFYEEPPEPIDYAAIERLAAAQKAARLGDVPPELSDLVFAICQNQSYSIVFMSITDPNSGLFECNNSHEVYSVSGPIETPDDAKSEGVITGKAFYFGTTSDALINRYFPPSTGAKYLFRDFRPSTNSGKTAKSDEGQLPSELVLLLPANSDEELVTNNLSSIANLLREHGDAELRLSIFYNESLGSVLTTRDFILIAAAGTITLNDWLPHGSTYQSIIGDEPGTYKFEIDHDLPALVDLGADPTLYAEQTRNAIKSHRHITTLFTGIPTSDALRTQLLEGFVEP